MNKGAAIFWSILTVWMMMYVAGFPGTSALTTGAQRLFLTRIASRPTAPSNPNRKPLSTMAQRAPAVVNAKKEHKATVIFLHGLGDQGDGWAESFSTEARHDNIKYICPHSASRAVTLNMGMTMPAWFDLLGLEPSAREDEAGITQATRLVHVMIDEQVRSGTPANKIVIGGFSMGGALALYAGLTYPHKLGGIVGLSSFLVQREKVPGSHTANLQTPVFLGHGTNDFLVPLTFGQMSADLIKKFNPNVQFKTYPMAHSSHPQEMKDLKDFLNNIAK